MRQESGPETAEQHIKNIRGMTRKKHSTEVTTQIPENLKYYIDYERMGRDLEINDVLAIETGFEEVHIFWRR